MSSSKKMTTSTVTKAVRKLVPSWTGPSDRGVVPSSTAEHRLEHWLCSPHASGSGFTDNINWRIFRIMAEFVEGFEFLSELKNEVSIFGSARSAVSDPYYKVAKELGGLCGKNGFTVITGGGPGIMEAANWGAFEAGGESIGLDISLPTEQRRNQFVKKAIGFRYFFTRKVMLSAASQAYVFFPGGFGTLDELFEMLTLIQTGKMSDEVPVILVGKKYWEPMLSWLQEYVYDEFHDISKEDMELFHLVDTADEAFAIIKNTKERIL